MYTVNYTNFFEFGVDAGDAQVSDDGGLPPINLSIPIQFFGRTQHTLYVSLLCILSLKIWSGFKWTLTRYQPLYTDSIIVTQIILIVHKADMYAFTYCRGHSYPLYLYAVLEVINYNTVTDFVALILISYLLGNVSTVVFYGEYCMCGVIQMLIQHEVKLSTSTPLLECIISHSWWHAWLVIQLWNISVLYNV